MTAAKEHPVQAEDISKGLAVLKRRQTKLSLMSIGSVLVFAASCIAVFAQQDFVFSFFGLTQAVEQLHLPYTVDAMVTQYQNQPDYLFNLLAWFGWLILKVVLSLIGAFMAIAILKKMRFFYVRFQSFILKFVAWLIAVIVLWSGLTYLQYDLRDDDHEEQYHLVHYEQHIGQSQIAQLLDETEANSTVKAYVLAQTALLHEPIDKDAATSYVAQLIQAERTEKNFIEYGFKPEQLWVMQQQLYGQAMTPIAKSVVPKVQQAEQVSNIVRIVLLAIAVLSMIISIVLYLLSSRIRGRTQRIEQNIH
ncbi:hypothetical protein AMD27_05130 [Acinetobacter sp. TGL-Y2]|uniref:hypothetical protein n=1 Tax=Acinetobacter sp. TGL-Y2 TaxID=1407071 RepID=UPI0007A66492|nr:hypothetical protein [Acinetobacter sp. TGL-Y2]AMW78322.1 hypothetical protein AMD27_05130 [Acinetobacter sp. TGL-Y2]